MKRHRTEHTHPCATCGQRYICFGDLERNYDGFPEVVCDLFHKHDQRQCIDCQAEHQEQA